MTNILSFHTEVTCNLRNLEIYTAAENTIVKVKERSFKVVIYRIFSNLIRTRI